MRKHDVRKWIHAVLDMLPLFIIPIFAIYMHRHPVTNYEVVYTENNITESVEYTYKYSTNDVVYNNGTLDTTTLVNGNAYLLTFRAAVTMTQLTSNLNGLGSVDGFILDSDSYLYGAFSSALGSRFIVQKSVTNTVNVNNTFYIYDSPVVICLSDYSVFIYSNYTNYTKLSFERLDDSLNPIVSASIVEDGEIVEVTYDDLDIGSQFVYSLYLPINKYFNFNNVGTFNNMYQWFTTNFFNGNVPLVVPIVWNIILYEFIMDVLFLIYAVFMFIVDFVECLIDKAFGKSYRGGR